jgi:hypothetical protein
MASDPSEHPLFILMRNFSESILQVQEHMTLIAEEKRRALLTLVNHNYDGVSLDSAVKILETAQKKHRRYILMIYHSFLDMK